MEKIFEDGLVAAGIADGGGWGVSEIGGEDAVVFENYGTLGAGDFDAARVAGIGGGGGVENTQSAAGEFEDGCGGVFGFDFMKQSGGAGLNASDITEEPEEQVNGVDALIDEGAAAVER